MVLRGEHVQRCGPGRCTLPASHALIKQIAKLHSDSGRTLAWSDPCGPASLSLPTFVSCRLIAISQGTLTVDQLSLC